MQRRWCSVFAIWAALLCVAGCSCGDDNDSESSDQADDDSIDDDSADDDATDDDLAPPDIPPPPWTEPAAPTRSVRSLDGEWSFTPEGYPARPVPVPCFWEAVDSWEGWEQYACPEYLADTPDETLSVIEGVGWEDRAIHRGVYELQIDIPDPAPATRLRFEALHHQGEVYWNNETVGEAIGAYREAVFDVSERVVAGANALRVELEDGAALLGPDGLTRWPVGYYSHTDITGIYRPVTLESLPDVFIDDIFVVPSVARGDLTVEVTLTNTRAQDVTLWLRGRASDADDAVVLETGARPMRVRAGASARTVFVEPFADARWWSPADPYLYQWRMLLMESDGAPIDLREDRFGFREFGIAGGHFVLNGERANLIGDSVDDQASRPRYWGPKYWSCETARDTMERILDLNFNVIRFHQAPPPDCVYDIADELGLFVIAESSAFARIDIQPPLFWKPGYLDNARTWIGEWVRRLRNHPAIVMWSVENELFMYGIGFAPGQAYSLGAPAKAADRIVRPDGSLTTPRPINWDGDSSFFRNFFGMQPETINWHYPAGPNLTVTPDVEWYDDALARFEPYLSDDVPTGVGETMDVRRPEWIDHTPDQAKAMQGIAVRAMRILGYSDMRPYKLNWVWHDFDPEGHEHPWADDYHSLYTAEQKEALLVNIRASYHPIAIFDREYTRTATNPDGSVGPVALPASTTITRTLVSFNDAFLPDEAINVKWVVRDGMTDEEYGDGAFVSTAPQGGREDRTIAFDAPESGRNLVLRIEAEMESLRNGPFAIEYLFVTE